MRPLKEGRFNPSALSSIAFERGYGERQRVNKSFRRKVLRFFRGYDYMIPGKIGGFEKEGKQ